MASAEAAALRGQVEEERGGRLGLERRLAEQEEAWGEGCVVVGFEVVWFGFRVGICMTVEGFVLTSTNINAKRNHYEQGGGAGPRGGGAAAAGGGAGGGVAGAQGTLR